MADAEHVTLLQQGVEGWNAWRVRNPSIHPDLSGANLNLADLSGANLNAADLGGADLRLANLRNAQLDSATLTGVDLREADLREANLFGAQLQGAKLCKANLRFAMLLDADLTEADLTGSFVFGASTWRLTLDGTQQRGLVITEFGKPEVTVDDIEVAQFVYLLLNNQKIRSIIDTVTTKAVLILGRFSKERKEVLGAISDELRKRNLVPIIFDFSIPASRDVTETVRVLAGLARFVVADVTDATEVRAELHTLIQNFPSLPVQPILLHGQAEFISLSHLRKFPWVLPTFEYDSQKHLLDNIDLHVIAPAEAKVFELRASP